MGWSLQAERSCKPGRPCGVTCVYRRHCHCGGPRPPLGQTPANLGQIPPLYSWAGPTPFQAGPPLGQTPSSRLDAPSWTLTWPDHVMVFVVSLQVAASEIRFPGTCIGWSRKQRKEIEYP